MVALLFCLQVHCIGQVVGVVLAETQQLAREAAQAVRIEYEELTPIITIEVLQYLDQH